MSEDLAKAALRSNIRRVGPSFHLDTPAMHYYKDGEPMFDHYERELIDSSNALAFEFIADPYAYAFEVYKSLFILSKGEECG